MKAVRELDVLKLFGTVFFFQNLWLIMLKKLATFGCAVRVFLPRKLKLVSDNLNGSAKEIITLSFSEQPLQ